MLGNDLVSYAANPLREANRHQKYLHKTFTKKEREAIQSSRFLYAHLLLWSAKEAAFKAFMQLHPKQEKFYAPKKFEVDLRTHRTATASGMVSCQNHSFSFTTQIEKNWLHTVCCKKEADINKAYCEIQVKGEKSERWLTHPDYGKLHLRNNEFGIPQPFKNKQKIPGFASVSHDGEWEALVTLVQ